MAACDQTLSSMLPSVLVSNSLDDNSMSVQDVFGRNGRPPLVHMVSIVVEPVGDSNSVDEPDSEEYSATEGDDEELVNTKSHKNEELVKNVMNHARLRKEEFARLLEEHAQIVKEINKAENSLL